MPVPDMFTMCKDFSVCDVCGDEILSPCKETIVCFAGDVPKEGETSKGKITFLCPTCYNKVKNDPEFAAIVERKMFNDKQRLWRQYKSKE